MPKFAANLSFMFTEVPFAERFGRAAAAGFAGVEYLFPYEWPAREVAGWLTAAGVEQVLFNLAPGDWAAGERGLACLPDRRGEFAESVEQGLEYALVLDCERVHCMAGLTPAGVSEAELAETYIANLRHAADRFATIGATVLIEPINTRDMPGYFLHRQEVAHRVVQTIGAPNLKVQMDLYHCQIMEGDVATKIREYLPTGRVGHFQIAGVPMRHEPDLGEVNYLYLFDVIDEVAAACHWEGWVGCEYRPVRGPISLGTREGLGWIQSHSFEPSGMG